jgi:hypothetical protein
MYACAPVCTCTRKKKKTISIVCLNRRGYSSTSVYHTHVTRNVITIRLNFDNDAVSSYKRTHGSTVHRDEEQRSAAFLYSAFGMRLAPPQSSHINTSEMK